MNQEDKKLDLSLKKIAKSSFIVLIGVVLSKVLTYVYRIIIARGFGPEAYGLFSLALMVSGWFIAFSGLGLSIGLLRYISIYRGKKESWKITQLFKSSLSILALTGIIAGIIMFLISTFLSENIFRDPNLTIYLQSFSLIVPLSIILTALISTLRAHEKIVSSVIIGDILTSTFNVVIISFLILIGLAAESVIISYVSGVFLVTFVAFLVTRKRLPILFRKTPKNSQARGVLKEVLSYSWPFLFAGFIWKIFHWTDSFFIGVYFNSAEVGIYNAAIPIAFLLTVSLQLFMQLFFPLVTKEYSKGNKEEVKQLSQQVGKWVVLLNLPATILLLMFPETVLNILFGQEYLPAANSLRILAVGMFFYSFSGISEKLIGVSGKSKLIFVDSIILAVINIALNFILVPKFGIEGAATSTAISLLILSIILNFQSSSVLSIVPVRRKMANILLALATSTAVLYGLSRVVSINIFSFIALSILFLFVYLSLVFLFRGFDRHDISVLKAILKKIKSSK